MNPGTIQIIVNPNAGSGKAKRIAPEVYRKIQDLLKSEINLTYTREKRDATRISRQSLLQGASLIVVIGGDGTINEVVNGFFINGKPINPTSELGIINCGTGGGLAKTLSIPGPIDQQIGMILQPRFRSLDLGHLLFLDGSKNPESRLFVSECQTGIGSKVAAMVGRKHKLMGGKLAYGIPATLLALNLKPSVLELKYDDEPVRLCTLLGLVVGNATVCGGGMKPTPDARLDDGVFDVLEIHEMSRVKRLINLSKVYTGSHLSSPGFSVRRCKRITVRSEEEISLEADGEVLGYIPMEIDLIPAAIRVKTVNY